MLRPLRIVANRLRAAFTTFPKTKPVFVHVPKTAGTSLRKTFRTVYVGLPAVRVSNGRKLARVREMPEREFQRAAFYSGHFGLETADRVAGGKLVFTFLRDPAERLASHYFHWRRIAPSSAAYNVGLCVEARAYSDLASFLAGPEPRIAGATRNQLVRYLALPDADLANPALSPALGTEHLERAKENLARLDLVGFVERFDEDFTKLLLRLGIEGPETMPWANKTKGRPALADLSARDRVALEAAIELDRALYDWARVRFWDPA